MHVTTRTDTELPGVRDAWFDVHPGPDVLPTGACHVAVRGGSPGAGSVSAAVLEIPLPRELERAVLKRQLEFRAGRYCARAALVELGHGPMVPPRGESGVPLWPAGVVGSITHTDGYARAAVASTDQATAIGIDTERIISPRRAALVAATIAAESEIETAMRAGLSRCEAVTLAFSAKESVFKCLHGLVGRRFGFADARLGHVDCDARTYTMELVRDLSDRCPAGLVLAGRFLMEPELLHTGLLLGDQWARPSHKA